LKVHKNYFGVIRTLKIFLNKLKVKQTKPVFIYSIFNYFFSEFLLRTSSDESTNPTTISTITDDPEIRRGQINKLIEIGFTEQQSRIALKRTRFIYLYKINLF
jgi:hypothetical protein